MKTIILTSLLVFNTIFCNQQNKAKNTMNTNTKESIYQFKVEDINGNQFDFSTLAGKKIMIVNTASKCGFTPQYKDLQMLYEKYKDKNFIIVGFPSNDFLWQEPGSNQDIAAFCQKNYGVTFPMMAKITVTGRKKHPLYKFLTEKSKNGLEDSKVKWNFQKYLIDNQGFLYKKFASSTNPMDKEITEWIENE